jgi:hypothetical protein
LLLKCSTLGCAKWAANKRTVMCRDHDVGAAAPVRPASHSPPPALISAISASVGRYRALDFLTDVGRGENVLIYLQRTEARALVATAPLSCELPTAVRRRYWGQPGEALFPLRIENGRFSVSPNLVQSLHFPRGDFFNATLHPWDSRASMKPTRDVFLTKYDILFSYGGGMFPGGMFPGQQAMFGLPVPFLSEQFPGFLFTWFVTVRNPLFFSRI